MDPKSVPKTKKKLHRQAEKRNRKTIVIVVIGILLVSGALLLPKYLPQDSPKKSNQAPKEVVKEETTPVRSQRAQVTWLDGTAKILKSGRLLEKDDWLWDQEGVEVGVENAASLRLPNECVLDLPPQSAVEFSRESNLIKFLRGGITLDSRKQKDEEDLVVNVGDGEVPFRLKSGSMAIVFKSPNYSELAASQGKFSLVVHCWQGSLITPFGDAVTAGSSRLWVFGGTRINKQTCELDLTLAWKEAAKSRQGSFTRKDHKNGGKTEFAYAKRSHLSPREQLLCDDVARQVEGIALGTRLDVDLVTLLEEQGIMENGLRLEGGDAGDPTAIVSFIDADGNELIKGVLSSVVGKLDEAYQTRARRIIAHRFFSHSDGAADDSFVTIEVTQAGLSKFMGTWVQCPQDFEHKAIVVRKEALANKKILLFVIAEMINCAITETDWGYKLARK